MIIEGGHVRGVVLGLAETIEGADRHVNFFRSQIFNENPSKSLPE